MGPIEEDPTDRGLSRELSDDDLDAIRRARRAGLIAADVPSGPPASAETRARVLARVAAERGWSRPRSSRGVHRPCRSCGATPGQWCRRSPREARRLGFAHPGRESDTD